MNGIIFPYVQIERINESLVNLTAKLIENIELTSTQLMKVFDISKSMFYNMLSTLKAFSLLDGERFYRFTDIGKKYVYSLLRKEEEESKAILKDILNDLDYIKDIIQKLSNKGRLSNKEIGNFIAIDYEQNWTSPQTIRTYGSAIASAMSFAGFGFYKSSILTVSDKSIATESLSPPYVRFDKILKILDALYPSDKELEYLTNNLETKKGRLGSELANCIDLDLIERSYRGIYRLTPIGEELISPYNEDNQKIIFKNTLLKSRYRIIIKEIRKIDSVNIDDLSKPLSFEFGKLGYEWNTETTIRTYAKVFLNWLVNSQLVEKKEHGQYQWSQDFSVVDLNDKDLLEKNELKEKFTSINSLRCYKLGKLNGLLMDQNLDFEDSKEIIEKIIAICREEDLLKPLIEEIQRDYKLFLEIKDSRIFERNIRQIEKTLGVKEI